MLVWLLVAHLYVREAMSPVIVVPNIVSEQECRRLGRALVFRHPHDADEDIHCTSYEAAK